jgi:hypothetical protein
MTQDNAAAFVVEGLRIPEVVLLLRSFGWGFCRRFLSVSVGRFGRCGAVWPGG